jgi:penicillin-binding protein 1A
MLRFLGWLFGAACMLFLGIAGAAVYVIWDVSKDLPDYKQLAAYEPPVMTRMHAADGSLLGEFAEERRLYVPIQFVPKNVINAYLSAEDKTFYEHSGLDYNGLFAAVYRYVVVKLTGKGQIVGASTITQQVAKNMLVGNDRTATRKIKEALVVQRIEQAFTKDQILELYLNEIFLGGDNVYGVAAAALYYFGKSLDALELEEIAYLAALPKGPNNYNPFDPKKAKRAQERRDWVLDQMALNGHISKQQAEDAKAKPFKVSPRSFKGQLFAAEGFGEEVRRQLLKTYGKERLSKSGFSVRTTIDPKLQIYARQSLAKGLIGFDRRRGYRGPLEKIELDATDWATKLEKHRQPADVAPWRSGVVLEVTDGYAKVGLQPPLQLDGKAEANRETGLIPLANLQWARSFVDGTELGPEVTAPQQVLAPGDIIVVAPAADAGQFHLVQMPDVEGALVAMDPHTGRVLAMVGGFSYGSSQFNRATQAKRQPGSAFKPIVYAAALDNGYTPSSVVMDAPIEFRMQDGKIWKPKNYQEKFYGPSTLRRGIEQSRNAMTVRLADELGMIRIADLAERLGIYDKMPKHMALALGAGETTLLRMTAAYSIIANGGNKIEATFIDRIQDRFGKTVHRHDLRQCLNCNSVEFDAAQQGVAPAENPEQVMNPYTAYQITSMMEGVVERGTGKKIQIVGKPVAGKTGTSNDERDAWFIGYTPDLTVGVYVGYDNPKPMGKKRTGGELAAPIVADFMKLALRGKVAVPFRVPRAIELMPIDAKTGTRAVFGSSDQVILEAFKPGDEPPQTTNVIGEKQTASGEGLGAPQAGQGVILVPAQTPATLQNEPNDQQNLNPESDAPPAAVSNDGLTPDDDGLY